MTSDKRLALLILDAKSGDQDAMNEVIRRLKPLIRKYARKINNGIDDQTVEQELVEEIIRAVYKYEPRTEWGKQFLENYFSDRA